MKKILFAACVLAGLSHAPAVAADMPAPVYKAPPYIAPQANWSGFYLGGHAGYDWGRTRVLEWACFEQTHVDGVISRARFRKLYPDVIPTRPEEFEAWWADGTRALRLLDAQLATRDYLVGDALTAADLLLYAYVHRASEGGFDMTPFTSLGRWFTRIEARPNHLPIDVSP